MNVVGYWFSDKLALKASRAQPVEPGTRPELEGDRRGSRPARAGPDPAAVPDPVRPAERVRDRQEPQARGRRRHGGAAPAAAAGPAQGCARARVRAHQEPRHPRLVDRGDGGGIDLRDRERPPILAALRRRRRGLGPLGLIGTIATIILAPLAAALLQLAVSRQREYLADATGAQLLGQGKPLADALESLERGAQTAPMTVNPADGIALRGEPVAAHRCGNALHDPPADRRAHPSAAGPGRRLVGPAGGLSLRGGWPGRPPAPSAARFVPGA